MDRYRIEPDHGDTIYLEDEPLMATSEFEIMSYLGSLAGQEEVDDGF